MTNYGWHLKSFRPQYCSAITVLNDWHYQQIRKCIFKTNTNLISMNSQIQFGNLKTELQRSRASTDAEGRPGGQVSWLWVLPEDVHPHPWLQAQVQDHHHHRHRKWPHQSPGLCKEDIFPTTGIPLLMARRILRTCGDGWWPASSTETLTSTTFTYLRWVFLQSNKILCENLLAGAAVPL